MENIRSPILENGRYVNPFIRDCKRSFWDVLAWKLGLYDDKGCKQQSSVDFSYPKPSKTYDPSLPSATWVGHSTVYIRCFGAAFLTDPIFSSRCSPLSFLGPKRLNPPGIALDAIEHLDFVLISHDHYDHLDKRSVHALSRKFPHLQWIVSQGVRHWFIREGITNVTELSWWESTEIPVKKGTRVHVTAVPAQHFSGRGLVDQNKTLWCGFIIELQQTSFLKCCYFAGDTGYNYSQFKDIGAAFNSIDLSLIPIGCYRPKIFMAPVHTDPLEAFWIHKDVRSKLSFAVHWNTFTLSDEGQNQPPFDLYKALEGREEHEKFFAAGPGYVFNW